MSNNPYNQAKTTGELTKQVASALIDRRLRLTTAESCTGGSWRQRCARKRIRPHFTILA